MAYHNALGEGFGELFDWITFMQPTERRRLLQDTVVGAADSMTARALGTREVVARRDESAIPRRISAASAGGERKSERDTNAGVPDHSYSGVQGW